MFWSLASNASVKFVTTLFLWTANWLTALLDHAPTGVDKGFLPVSENRTLLSAFLRQCDSTRLHGREIKTCGLLAWSVQSNGTDHRNVRQKVKTTNRCESANNPDTQICRWVTTKTVSVCLCVGGWCGVGDTSARTTSYVYCWVGLLAIANNGAEKPINY